MSGFWRRQVAAAGLTTLVLVLLGAPVGLIWSALAPRLAVTAAGQGGINLVDASSEALVAADGYFVFVTAAVGLVCGVLAYAYGRRHGTGVVAGLAAGGVAAAVVAASVGRARFHDAFERAIDRAPVGTHLHLYLSVRAESALLAWAFIAVATFFLLTLRERHA